MTGTPFSNALYTCILMGDLKELLLLYLLKTAPCWFDGSACTMRATGMCSYMSVYRQQQGTGCTAWQVH
jgi:hypothetical protein